MRKSISGGAAPEKRFKEKRSKLVIHPSLGPVPVGSVPPPSDHHVADERTWFTDNIVACPCYMLGGMLLIVLVMSLVTLVKAPFELDISVDSFEIRGTHFSQQRYKSMNEAIKLENEHYTNRRQLWTAPHLRLGRLEIIYAPEKAADMVERPEEIYMHTDATRRSGIEMLRLDRLEYVRQIEQAIQEFDGYDTWCRKDNPLLTVGDTSSRCSPPSSLATYFFPTVLGNCDYRYDGLGTRIVRPIDETLEALAALENQDDYHWFFSAGHSEHKSTLIRSQFLFALDQAPTPEQREEFMTWLGDLMDALEIEKHNADNPKNGVKTLIGGPQATEILVLRALHGDMALAISSFALVLLYTWFHTGSFVLAVMAMTMIALSFPVSLFFYYLFFGDAKLGVLNVLSIYIVLGIGVDDCYVFLDAFQQTRHAPTLEQAFGAAFNRSARAMFVTSFTTALAFLANMISSIPVIFSFAVFMATLVVVNYLFTITLFVAMVAAWEKHVEVAEGNLWKEVQAHMPCLQRLCSLCDAPTELEMGPAPAPAPAPPLEVTGSHPAPDIDDFATLEDAFIVIDNNTPPGAQQQQQQAPVLKASSSDHDKILDQLRKHNINIGKLRKTERWFLFKFGPFLRRNRRNVMGFATLAVVFGAIMTSRLQPSKDIPHLFPPHHDVQLHWSFKNSNFTGGPCDECGAPFQKDFLCHVGTENEVDCGGGNGCQFGKCYESDGTRFEDDEYPCLVTPSEVEAACGVAMTAAAGSPATTDVSSAVAQDVLEVFMGVWRPSSGANALGCDDDYRECFAWAERGECDDNPAFMRHNCKYSCDLCTNEVEQFHQCDDGRDNEFDYLADCEDPDCDDYPKCKVEDAERDIIASTSCQNAQCREFLDNFLDACPNQAQRTRLKVFLQHADCPSNIGDGSAPDPLDPTCDFRADPAELDGTAFSDETSVEAAKCSCDSSEMSFYLASGLMCLALATFCIYAAYQSMNRRDDMFEHRLNMATAGMFYVYGVVPCCFWLSCFPGPEESKENGFFGMMLFCGICMAMLIVSIRKKWSADFTQRPDTGNQYLYFCVVCTAVLITFSIVGLAKTGKSKAYADEHEAHILSDCTAMQQYNITGDNFVAETMTFDEIEDEIRQRECNREDSSGCETAERCPPGMDECGSVETMAYSVGAFFTISGSVAILTAMRLEGLTFPASVTGFTVAPFLGHGALTTVFWFRCIATDTSQEQTYFILLLIWSCVVAAGQLLHAIRKKEADCGTCLMMTFAVGAVVFASMGVHVTSTENEMWLGSCSDELDSELIISGDGVTGEKLSQDDDQDEDTSVWADRACDVEEQCGPIEKTTYGAIGLCFLLCITQAFCLRGCRIVDLPKSVDGVTLCMWFLQTCVFLVFWAVCGASDASVEQEFWVFLMCSSVVLAIVLFLYGVGKDCIDVALKVQISLALGMAAVAALLVKITVGNGDPFLATCAVVDRCHWVEQGMTPAVDCEAYWDRLDAECSRERCNGHGICVGFRRTGGCICTPSFKGRDCTSEVQVNDNKAQVNIIFGLQGTMSEPDRLVAIAEDDPVGAPDYWQSTFDLSDPATQEHVANVCDGLAGLDNVLQVQSMECFMTDFRDWVKRGCGGDEDCLCTCDRAGSPRCTCTPCDHSTCVFPVPRDAFLNDGTGPASGGLLKKWLRLDGGKYFRHVGFDRDPERGHATRVSFARISVYTHLSNQAAGFTSLPIFNQVENFVARWNDVAPLAESGPAAGQKVAPAFQVSNLWIKMFTEVSAVNGIIYAIIIIAFCSFFTIFVFTGHVRMAVIVVSNVFAMLCTILGYFKAAGWSLGIVEAVSALVLLGSSVDYSLHVAEAFVDCSQHNRVSANPMGRSALVTQALTKIGVSVMHAAGTTFLSVVCLLFCTVTLFVKFGQIIMVSVLISIAFALMPLPASLGLLGPKRFRRSFKRQVFMLFAMTVLMLLSIMIVYSLDASGRIDVVGPAGEPLFGRKMRVDNGALDDL
jgi:predicted RND superfamily exporter protein